MNEKSLPELTIRSILLGIILSVVLAGANAYLGLFAGMTVSASIPAAVISMGILKLLKKSNVLENNIVQTAASAGESLAAGVIFTFPALVLMGFWQDFNYLWVTLIAGFGGLLGVLFTIPLRRSLIIEENLQFPEGVATAEVLKTGEKGGQGLKIIVKAATAGAVYKLGSGKLFGLFPEVLEGARSVGSSVVYLGSNLSPALISVGYIVGLNIAILIFLGGAVNWFVAIPVISAIEGGCPDSTTAADWAYQIWSTKTRYIGVGAMLIGGLWTIFHMRKSLISGVLSGLKAYQHIAPSAEQIERTEKDIPMKWIIILIITSIVPLFLVYQVFVRQIYVSLVMAVVMLVIGFVFSAVAGYMAGLVGSSNNPISGVTISTVLVSALLLLLLMGSDSVNGPAAAIIVGGVVCCAAAIAGDNMQDLKAGHILGATPWKQQLMQIVGTISAALVMAPVLTILLKAYGFEGHSSAKEGALAAPQAGLMAAVAKGVFEKNLPWTYIAIGFAGAIAIIIADLWFQRKRFSFRMPVLAVAIGIYLPFELSVPIFIGGLLHTVIGTSFKKREASVEQIEYANQTGLLFASGLITGEALMGILIAIPVVVLLELYDLPKKALPLFKMMTFKEGGRAVFSFWTASKAQFAQEMANFSETPIANLLGVVLLLGVIIWMYKTIVNSTKD
ncbi:MAG: oligopeptide transporter, OPT family [Phycisphaerae bacterium]|nr:oligopeptide transporter, OPT family [Phycisphaerae bacterium]